MMKTAHTPGPWIWNRDRPVKYDLDWLDGVGKRILTIYSNGEITPDKALIAAAPDLLEAAMMAHRALLERVPGSVPGGEEACDALRVAIIKAVPPPKTIYATISVSLFGHDIPVEVGYTGEKSEDELYEMAKDLLRRTL